VPTSAALTIWIASSQLDLPITDAITHAASEILGPNVSVQAVAYPDAQPEAIHPPAEGERSVQISWESSQHEGARLTLCRAPHDCFERSVSFRTDDPELERGRTVGFLATSVFLENVPQALAPAPPEKQLAPPRPRAPSAPPEHKGSISAAATLAAPGDGTSLGARLDADYALFDPFRVGAGVEARFGDVAAAQASSRIVSVGLTFGWSTARPSRALWLGVQLGLGAYALSLSHLSSDDPAPDRQSRVLFGGDLTVRLALDMNEFSALFLEPGVEVLSGKTDVVVDGQVVATWPIAIPVLRFGLRAGL
jgi:hypothetical protein